MTTVTYHWSARYSRRVYYSFYGFIGSNHSADRIFQPVRKRELSDCPPFLSVHPSDRAINVHKRSHGLAPACLADELHLTANSGNRQHLRLSRGSMSK